ncbi:DDE_3 domain-containing protein [Trichonephila clavipes]|nr:DDE_3 domain-containing protein [Trichonephila clavipes]
MTGARLEKQAYDQECLLPAVKHGGDGIFQDDDAPIHAVGLVQSWFQEYEDEVKHLPWPTQSPDLSIIEPLSSVLERSIWNRHPPSGLSQYFRKEKYNIPLNTIQPLYESIPRQIQAVLLAKGGPATF